MAEAHVGLNVMEGEERLDDSTSKRYAFLTKIDDTTTPVFNVCGRRTRYGCTQRERCGCGILSCFIFVPLLIFFCVACIPSDISSVRMVPLSSNPPTTLTTFRVLLLGDSNWGKPVVFYDLMGKIHGYLPQYRMNISVSGNAGVKMENLRQYLPGILAWARPDMTLLYVSSDVSNVVEELMTPLQKLRVRRRYQENLLNVTRGILRYRSKLAIVGPGILGEQIFKPLRSGDVSVSGRVPPHCTVVRLDWDFIYP